MTRTADTDVTSIRTYRLALLAALALVGCGSAGVALKRYGSEQVQLAHLRAGSEPELTVAEPVLAPDVVNGFDFLYRFITETEFVLCLEGSVHDGRLHIEGFRLARIDATSANHVRYQPCMGEPYVGTAHNHPSAHRQGVCTLSEPDRRSFAGDIRAVVDIVLCGNTKFVWTLKDGRGGIGSLPAQLYSNARDADA